MPSAEGVRDQSSETQGLLLARLLPRQSTEFDPLFGKYLQDTMADQVLAGDLGVAGARRGHVAPVVLTGQACVVQVDDDRLLVVTVRGPAALAGWIAGTADAWQTLSPLGFTHGDPFTVDSPVVQPDASGVTSRATMAPRAKAFFWTKAECFNAARVSRPQGGGEVTL
jgi:hypothetical protein